MTTLASIIKAAQQVLGERASPDLSDADSLTDEQLAALAGPGHAEVVAWDEHGTLPSSVPGLTLLSQLLESRAWATL